MHELGDGQSSSLERSEVSGNRIRHVETQQGKYVGRISQRPSPPGGEVNPLARAERGRVPLRVVQPFCLFILDMLPGHSTASCSLTFEIQPLSGSGWVDLTLRSHIAASFSCWTHLASRMRGLLGPYSSIFDFSIFH